MSVRQAGQKRKLTKVPQSKPEDDELARIHEQLNGTLKDGGSGVSASSELSDRERGLEIDSFDDDDTSGGDESLSLENEVGARSANVVATPERLVGSDTARAIIEITPKTPVVPLENGLDQNYRTEFDANGNLRYIYHEIDPVYDSDDSDVLAINNTIGNIPLSYYDAYPHIGYDINGRKIARPAKGEALDSLLESINLPEGWTGLTDPSSGKPLQLNREELEVLRKLTQNEAPGSGYDPYPDMVEYFTGKGMEEVMPLSAAPEPKRRFVPSMHEHKRVMKMVKAIKEGRILPYREPTTEDREQEELEQELASYDIWSNEAPKPDHPMNVPAPKLPPPGYAESYHPPPEYLPDNQEREAWENADDEDRKRDFLPQDHSALRKVPGYGSLLKEKFERCLDLYLAPRVRRSKLNIDPESLLPKLPDPSELKPFPTSCATVFLGHEGRVRSVSVDPSAKYIASGGDDGTVRVWELVSGRQLWQVKLSSSNAVNVVAWRPGSTACILAACCDDTVYLMVPQGWICDSETEALSHDILESGFGYTTTQTTSSKDKSSLHTWHRPSTSLQDKGISFALQLQSTPKTLVWHRRGEYFSTVSSSTSQRTTSIAIHTLSKHQTQYPFRRLKGLAQTVCFHPSKPLFFVATRQRIRIYDLQQQKLEKELLPGARWISDISLHPMGSNLLVSSYDKRLLWHDLDLGSTPYKTLRYHSKAIRSVKFHPSLPLFADASDDASLQVFHGKVVADSMENATVVPLKVLRGHKVKSDLGVLDLAWHPDEAWIVSGGADGTVRLWT